MFSEINNFGYLLHILYTVSKNRLYISKAHLGRTRDTRAINPVNGDALIR